MDAVPSQQPLVHRADSLEIARRRFPPFGEIFHLIIHFARVQGEQRILPGGQFHARAQQRFVAGGRAVRRDNRAHQRFAPPCIKHPPGDFKPAARLRAVARRLRNQRFAEIAAHARLHTRARHLILKIIHIHKRRHARQQHFSDAEHRAAIDQLTRHRLVFQRKQETAQPVWAVVAHRAERHHRHMAVRVHKSGEQNAAARIDPLVCVAYKTPRAHLGDIGAVRQHIAPVEYAHLVVHRQNDGVFNQCFHASSLIKSIAAAQNTATLLPKTASSKSNVTVCCTPAISVIARI